MIRIINYNKYPSVFDVIISIYIYDNDDFYDDFYDYSYFFL